MQLLIYKKKSYNMQEKKELIYQVDIFAKMVTSEENMSQGPFQGRPSFFAFMF